MLRKAKAVKIGGSVSNVDMYGNNSFNIKYLRVLTSTFETLPK
jgi:hypothetical protein